MRPLVFHLKLWNNEGHVNPNRKLQSSSLRGKLLGFVVRLPGQQSMSMQVQTCTARYKPSVCHWAFNLPRFLIKSRLSALLQS